jgi:hypothetical protein
MRRGYHASEGVVDMKSSIPSIHLSRRGWCGMDGIEKLKFVAAGQNNSSQSGKNNQQTRRRNFMVESKKPNLTEQQKQRIIEGLWLTYYNDTLYAKGVITEEDRNKMRLRIKARTAGHER